MTSDQPYKEAFVWIWLPGETGPVVAGRLTAAGDQLLSHYGKSYLARNNAIALYESELPLQAGLIPLLPGLSMPGCIRDGSPDAWGRRAIINRKLSRAGTQADSDQFDELTYLLESGSDRVGALDFQRSATEYVPRTAMNVSLDELVRSAERVEKGLPLSPELDQALLRGTSIGGARPKAQMPDGQQETHRQVFVGDRSLQPGQGRIHCHANRRAGGAREVAPVSLVRAMHKEVLLIERFDRVPSGSGWQRKAMVSVLTMLALDEMIARYASY